METKQNPYQSSARNTSCGNRITQSPGRRNGLAGLHKTSICYALTGLVAFVIPSTVYAYVGPGAGITAIGSVLALLAGILFAIIGFVWYPLKRLFRSISKKSEGNIAGTPDKQDTKENS